MRRLSNAGELLRRMSLSHHTHDDGSEQSTSSSNRPTPASSPSAVFGGPARGGAQTRSRSASGKVKPSELRFGATTPNSRTLRRAASASPSPATHRQSNSSNGDRQDGGLEHTASLMTLAAPRRGGSETKQRPAAASEGVTSPPTSSPPAVTRATVLSPKQGAGKPLPVPAEQELAALSSKSPTSTDPTRARSASASSAAFVATAAAPRGDQDRLDDHDSLIESEDDDFSVHTALEWASDSGDSGEEGGVGRAGHGHEHESAPPSMRRMGSARVPAPEEPWNGYGLAPRELAKYAQVSAIGPLPTPVQPKPATTTTTARAASPPATSSSSATTTRRSTVRPQLIEPDQDRGLKPRELEKLSTVAGAATTATSTHAVPGLPARHESEEKPPSTTKNVPLPSIPSDSKGDLQVSSRAAASDVNGHTARTSARAQEAAQHAEQSRRARPSARRRPLGKPLSHLTTADVAISEDDLRADIRDVWTALHLFCNSRMIEAEEICLSGADHRMYFALGNAMVVMIKSLMTFEPADLEHAIQCCHNAIAITHLLRRKDSSVMESVGRLAKGSTSVATVRSMTLVQRHAELVYAECLLLKAVVGIIYSGDFIAFVKEALHLRNAYAIYRTLKRYVEQMDEEHGGEDPSVDQDFRSGVCLGNGAISLILSLLPSSVLKITEVFGFAGDREYALSALMLPGQWKPKVPEPGIAPDQEGIRRPVCDLLLLMYHLVISSVLPVAGTDVETASNIVSFNLARYPQGVFFLYFSGRMYATQTLEEKAIEQLQEAIDTQREYVQLHHICHYDMGLVSLASGDYERAHDCFEILRRDSQWSKAMYTYSKAVTFIERGIEPEECTRLMHTVPDLLQRIAGKSIPIEKFVARRAKKYAEQGNRLLCPGIELAFVLNGLNLASRLSLCDKHLTELQACIDKLEPMRENPAAYGKGFWDDYCLAHMLRGIVLRLMAYPEPHAISHPKESPIPIETATEEAFASFNNVLAHGLEIEQDHFLVWFTHFELGRLYASTGQYQEAAKEYQKIMSGKGLEYQKKSRGKVSLQNMCVLRANAALTALQEGGRI